MYRAPGYRWRMPGERIVILGAPRAGKTTAWPHANHADDLIPLFAARGGTSWEQLQVYLTGLMLRPGPWTWEGVACTRALRACLARPGKPCDVVFEYWTPRTRLSRYQTGLATGTRNVFESIRPELVRRGVRIQTGTL
jgi:hypothetical protein